MSAEEKKPVEAEAPVQEEFIPFQIPLSHLRVIRTGLLELPAKVSLPTLQLIDAQLNHLRMLRARFDAEEKAKAEAAAPPSEPEVAQPEKKGTRRVR